MIKLAKRLGKQPGNIQLFPLCETDWRGRKVIILEDKADG